MGDQIGVAVSGTLYYVPYIEFERIRELQVSPVEKTRLFAALCRINTLYMIGRAGSGHIGSSFSSMDIMSWVLLNEIRTTTESDNTSPHDIFFSSKGHDAPGYYSTLIALGKLDFDFIHRLRRLDGLPGHPDISTPNIITNTGSLGMGVSKAKGMIIANRILKRSGNIYVLMGDGELQEGQFWESLISAVNLGLHELTVIIDHNKIQSDTLVAKVSDLGDLESKLKSFGWHVSRCDGNDLSAFSTTILEGKGVADKPKVIIADTIKGKGVSFMEHTSIDSDIEFYKFHSGAPSDEAYVKAAQELIDSSNKILLASGASPLELETVNRPVAVLPDNPQRLIQAYSNALIAQARRNPSIVALDADLVLDTGLIPFQKEFPERFVECGIAEQDMVSQAGGMALRGILPIVHSFACFLSARPNEQIYNNATERTKIIYVGSLAGVLPGGPGHSHQAVRDISALAAVPGLILMEPSCEYEVGLLLDWCITSYSKSSYIRINSIPWVNSFELPSSYDPHLGCGVSLTEGSDALIFAYGPVMLSSAVLASRKLWQEYEITVKVINLPWLNYIDKDWLIQEVGEFNNVFSLDNHYLIGGQGDRIAEHFAAEQFLSGKNLHRIGLRDIPVCGNNNEVMNAHGFNAESLVDKIFKALKTKINN